MHISPINYNLNSTAQNFCGLWGKTSSMTDYDESMGIPKVEDTYYYYPFSDESYDEIQEVINKNTYSYVDDLPDSSKYIVKSCKVCTTLPFKKANFTDYLNFNAGKKLTSMIKRVHFCVKDKFMTNAYGTDQQSAANEAVSMKILNLKV